MPILPPEPAVYPVNLFDDAIAAEESNRRWYVMHTRPQQEKALARELRRWGIPFYLPLIPQRGRSRTAYVPLFPGYLAVFAGYEERLAALSTHRVVRPLEVVDQRRLRDDLCQIEQLISGGKPVRRENRLQPGRRVRIQRGPLAGLIGTIQRTASGSRFVVQIDFIQRGASILVDESVLEPIA